MEKFCVKARLNSFKFAARGIKTMLISQHNAWIHAIITIIVITLSIIFGFTRFEWCWITLAIVAVWTAEALNTTFEFLADVASPEFHPLVEKAKDVAAGAVLISVIGSSIIGVLILYPYIITLLNK